MQVFVAYPMTPCFGTGNCVILPAVCKSYEAARERFDCLWDVVEYNLNISPDLFEQAELSYHGQVLVMDDDFEASPVVGVQVALPGVEMPQIEWAMRNDWY